MLKNLLGWIREHKVKAATIAAAGFGAIAAGATWGQALTQALTAALGQ